MRNSINQISFDMKKKEENKNSKNSINQKSLVFFASLIIIMMR